MVKLVGWMSAGVAGLWMLWELLDVLDLNTPIALFVGFILGKLA